MRIRFILGIVAIAVTAFNVFLGMNSLGHPQRTPKTIPDSAFMESSLTGSLH